MSRSRAAVSRTSGSLTRAIYAASGGECGPERFKRDLSAKGLLGKVRRDLLAFKARRAVFRTVRKTIKVAPALEQPLGWLRDSLEDHYRARENSRYANLLFVWALTQATQTPT